MAQSCFEVKRIEFGFKNNLHESNVEEKMCRIEERFFAKGIRGFRTISRSYAKNASDYNKIKFEFVEKDGIPMGDVIKIFEDWPEVVHIDYTVNLKDMVILII